MPVALNPVIGPAVPKKDISFSVHEEIEHVESEMVTTETSGMVGETMSWFQPEDSLKDENEAVEYQPTVASDEPFRFSEEPPTISIASVEEARGTQGGDSPTRHLGIMGILKGSRARNPESQVVDAAASDSFAVVHPGELSWDALKRSATGCVQDYFVHHSGSIRVDWPGRAHTDVDMDPLLVMKEGVMVLNYDMNDVVWERKLLKVDDQLRFIYLLDGQPKALAQTKSIAQTPLVSVPLGHVKHIYTMDDALHWCEANGINTENLQIDSTFVMWIEGASEKDKDHIPELDEEMPSAEKVIVLVAAPQQQLRKCIQACKDFNEGNSADSQHSLRVDQVALQDVEELLAKESIDFKFDISFRGQTALRTVTVFVEVCDKPDMGGLKEKLEGELLPVDLSRVHFVMQDAITLRRATGGIGGDIFKRGMIRFITDWEQLELPMPENMNVSDAMEEAAVVLRMLLINAHDNAECCYNECSTRSAIAALRHMFQLEHDFVLLVEGEAKEYSEDGDADGDGEADPDKFVGKVEVKECVVSQDTKMKKLMETRWRCEDCRYINKVTDTSCEVCGATNELQTEVHPAPKAKAQASLGRGDADAGEVRENVPLNPFPALAGIEEAPAELSQRALAGIEGATAFDMKGLEAEPEAAAEGAAGSDRRAPPEWNTVSSGPGPSPRPNKRGGMAVCTGGQKGCNQQ